jgi:hypothetical protein
MESQEQTTDPSNRPSFFGKFFGQPPDWVFWRQSGPRFWAGVLAGVGLGLMSGAVLVELELLTLHRRAWAMLVGMLFIFVGRQRLQVVVRRQAEGDQGRTGLS